MHNVLCNECFSNGTRLFSTTLAETTKLGIKCIILYTATNFIPTKSVLINFFPLQVQTTSTYVKNPSKSYIRSKLKSFRIYSNTCLS